MTDFRALCAELHRECFSLYAEMSATQDFNDAYLQRMDELRDRSSALLAAPQQGAPSNEEIDSFWWRCMEAPDVYLGLGRSGFRIAARELLTRYGAHAVPVLPAMNDTPNRPMSPATALPLPAEEGE